jgi:hypothetical protein
MGKMNLSYVDHDGEGSSVGVGIVDMNAGNFAATMTDLDAIRDAIEAVTLCTLRGRSIIAVTEEIAGVLPANGFAQRETKWLVSGVDANGQARTMEIPGADLSLLPSGSGVLNLASGVGQDLKDALDAAWVTPTGDAITVEQVIHVGRNL